MCVCVKLIITVPNLWGRPKDSVQRATERSAGHRVRRHETHGRRTHADKPHADTTCAERKHSAEGAAGPRSDAAWGDGEDRVAGWRERRAGARCPGRLCVMSVSTQGVSPSMACPDSLGRTIAHHEAVLAQTPINWAASMFIRHLVRGMLSVLMQHVV